MGDVNFDYLNVTSSLKDAMLAVPDKIALLFNESITTGKVPDAWKIGLIVPLQKDGDKLYTAHQNARDAYATLQKKMADQHQALLDKDAEYGTLQGELNAARAEIEANKHALLDKTEINQMKDQHAALKKRQTTTPTL